MVVDLNILSLSLLRLLDTTHHKAVARLLDFDLVILEVITGACRTNDLHLSGGAVTVRDFNGAANARHFHARSCPSLVRLVEFVALLEVAALYCFGSESWLRRSAGQHHKARKQSCNHHSLHLSNLLWVCSN